MKNKMNRYEKALVNLRKENAKLKRELFYKRHNISLLNLLNSNMHAALKLNEIYYIILTGITAQPGLGYNRAMLFVKNREENKISGVLAISPDDARRMHRFYEEAAEKKFDFAFYIEQYYNNNLEVKNRLNTAVSGLSFDSRAQNIITETLKDKKIRIIGKKKPADFSGLPRLNKILTKEFIIAPVFTRTEELGVVIADNYYTDKKIKPGDILTLQTLCDFAASIITSATKYEETERAAIYDDLTRLYNFRFMRNRLEEEIKRSERYKREFSIIMLDLDNFKEFNDKNGHLTGNKALMDLAILIKQNIRAIDIPVRYGGEEFVILLPETDKKGARICGDKLLEKVRNYKFIGAENTSGRKLTLSGGIATYPSEGRTSEELVDCADKLLYLAKAHGKNQLKYRN